MELNQANYGPMAKSHLLLALVNDAGWETAKVSDLGIVFVLTL